MADEIKASPRNQTLGKVADKLARLKRLANKYEILPQVPLLGGTGIGDLLMGEAPEEIANWSYGNAPMQIPEMSRIPQMKTGRGQSVADAMFLGADVGALGGVAAKLGARGLGELAGSAGRMMPVGPEPQLGVIKPKGGNWDDQRLKYAVERLKRPAVYDEMFANMVGNQENIAINNWVDKTLQKYVKNEMATPEDPLRLLAERNILHISPDRGIDGDRGTYVSYDTEDLRRAGGFPAEGMGKSDLAKYWENSTDNSMWATPAGALKEMPQTWRGQTYTERMPWLEKVDPETPVYGAYQLEDLGFQHLIDELANATNPDSGLPADLLLKYESLPKVTVPQAVERVAKINEWRAKQKAEADAARAMNPATQVFKEYPDQGYKWVELKQPEAKSVEELTKDQLDFYHEYLDGGVSPEGALAAASKRSPKALEDALKYEGETMGHCVGGYCPDVIEGRSQIYSLRDAKGMPHVTVEVGNKSLIHDFDKTSDLLEFVAGRVDPDELQEAAQDIGFDSVDEYLGALRDNYGKYIGDPYEVLNDLSETLGPKSREALDKLYSTEENIVQIKGKGNAKPKDDYLPFVQDFVKSGQWSDVGDLGNTGLRKFSEPSFNIPEGYYSNQELSELLKKAGVPESNLSGYLRGAGFAQGGLVTQYDPARIEALVSQLMDE